MTNIENSELRSRIAGSLAASAVGDAMGGSTEERTPQEIKARWGGWVEGIVDPYSPTWPTDRPASPFWKGDGHITDDTLMVRLLAEVYIEQGRHLTAFDLAEHLVPKFVGQRVWVPELDKESVVIARAFLTEKFLSLRHFHGNVDPREGGNGNAVNCGAAMYISPVGLVNAGDPYTAYNEAIDITGAHQVSYGREAAGVLAAAVAAALDVNATVDSVLDTAVNLAKDGTKAAIEAVLVAADKHTHWGEAIDSGDLREAIAPYDTVGENYRAPAKGFARRPSRFHTIEELPVALGLLKITGGDPWAAICSGVNYGRDSDSIASMAGSIAGALRGLRHVPADIVAHVSRASRTDVLDIATPLTKVAWGIRREDDARVAHVQDTFNKLTQPAV